jgi:photosystem II stability/assembly factor-like uncharacterized protein
MPKKLTLVLLSASWLLAEALSAPAQDLPFTAGFDVAEMVGKNWELEEGWTVDEVQGNPSLHGTRHSWARLRGGREWSDYRLGFRLLNVTGTLHANILVGEEGRYFIGLGEEGVYLTRESPWGTFEELAHEPELRLAPRQWHQVEVLRNPEGLEVVVDREPVLSVPLEDQPPRAGSIAFETLEGADIYVDDVVVEGGQVERREEYTFNEEVPAWAMPDLAVTRLSIRPDRADPGQEVIFHATVANLGTGDAGPSHLVFYVNGAPVNQVDVDPLQVGDEVELEMPRLGEPGRHEISAVLEATTFERSLDNNHSGAVLRVSGVEPPIPEVEVTWKGLQQEPEEGRGRLTVGVRNPGFAPVQEVPVTLLVDEEPIGERTIDHLPEGTESLLEFDWEGITPGEHLVTVRLDLSDAEYSRAGFNRNAHWNLVIPGSAHLYGVRAKNKWVSIGPRTIQKGVGGLTTGSTGRIHQIAFHPTDKNILYVGAPTCGLWKSTDRGASWKPLTDKMPSLGVGAIAVDPKNPQIVYFTTGSSITGGGIGVFKSTDGGKSWARFATQAVGSGGTTQTIGGVNELLVQYPSSGTVRIYAASDVGVLRYTSTNPWAKSSTASEWVQIKSGKIRDLVVKPGAPQTLFASVEKWAVVAGKSKLVNDGVYRTTKAGTATESDWKALPVLSQIAAANPGIKLDVSSGQPNVIVAAVMKPKAGYNLGLYRSQNGGDTWQEWYLTKTGRLYSPFVAIHPQNKDAVYFSGVKLYKWRSASQKEVLIPKIHDDMHAFAWDPFTQGAYYVGNDGGLWYCQVKSGDTQDVCSPRNSDLRVTQFYDFDASPNQSALMIGGTQDNGTILWEGKPDWKFIKGGDGAFSLIASTNNLVFYAQHQFLTSLARCDKGVNCWVNTWKSTSNGLPNGQPFYVLNAYVANHPNDATGQTVFAQGKEVYRTTDGGSTTWDPIGPKGSNVKGYVKRVVVQPKTSTILAGTTEGKIWYSSTGGVGTWKLMADHPDPYAYVQSMAFAPTNHRILYVVYRGIVDPYRRIERFEMNQQGSWNGSWITDNLPTKHVFATYVGLSSPMDVRTIAGDGHSDLVAYVGTDKGVFRGEAACGTCTWNWKPYNDGLPLVIVNDLLVDPTSKELRAATYGRGAWTVITGP